MRRAVPPPPRLLAVLVAAAVLVGCSGSDEEEGPLDPVVETAVPSVEEVETVPFDLYFPGEDGRLYAEPRELAPTDDPAQTVTRLVEELLGGPAVDGLRAPLPAGVAVARAFVGDDATVILDLVSPDAGAPPGVGSEAEMLMVYSVVNTVLLNVEEAERLVLLWNGRQPTTFAGHLDTARPLVPDTGLIAADEIPPLPLDGASAPFFSAVPDAAAQPPAEDETPSPESGRNLSS